MFPRAQPFAIAVMSRTLAVDVSTIPETAHAIGKQTYPNVQIETLSLSDRPSFLCGILTEAMTCHPSTDPRSKPVECRFYVQYGKRNHLCPRTHTLQCLPPVRTQRPNIMQRTRVSSARQVVDGAKSPTEFKSTP
jgi:hypothetical protein